MYQMKEGSNDESMAEIKYPCVEIPGHSQLNQNINNTILEAVKKLEDKIYEEAEGDVTVKTEYRIIYMTSKLASIEFLAEITDNVDEKNLFQFCNINIAKNGEKAYTIVCEWSPDTIAHDPNALCLIDKVEKTQT